MIVASLMAFAIIVPSFVGSAAADDSASKVATAAISLAGRWSGQHLGYGRAGDSGACANGDSGCTLTYDFVACNEGWCGIAVKDDKTCGAIGVRLAANSEIKKGASAFKGQLVITKGSAPYAVEAWYRVEGGSAKLLLIGDTGPELRIMRRSFPFEAELARTGDATCTLEKASA